MNKIKSFENIFPFYPLPCWEKLGGKKKICSRENKMYLVQNIQPLIFQNSIMTQCGPHMQLIFSSSTLYPNVRNH